MYKMTPRISAHLTFRYSLFSLLLLLVAISYADTVTDIDGNVYETVWIGNQHWMAENLKVTKYRNGETVRRQMIWDIIS